MNAAEGDADEATTLLQSGLEVRSRRVLEEGLSRIDARTRSRLNQARQAALAAAVARPSLLARWLGPLTHGALMPATGAAAAAVLVAIFMLSGGRQLTTAVADNPANALDVLDLVTDDDAMHLMEDNDSSFYEWAAAQSDNAGQGAGQGAGGATT
jgi:hypothetical protein